METENLHLTASEMGRSIDFMWNNLQQGLWDPSYEDLIKQASRFFGKNLTPLKECNETMVKLARSFQLASSSNFIVWDPKEHNVHLQLVITLMLRRADENLIRDLCSIFENFIKGIPQELMGRLANHHKKNCRLVLHKISKVTTFYTQLEILQILIPILRSFEDGGLEIFNQEGKTKNYDEEKVQKVFKFFNLINGDDRFKMSRRFLDFYNENFIKTPFTLSIDCFIFQINGRSVTGNIHVNFNLRNLSISFACENTIFKGCEQAQDKIYIEMEDCEIKAEDKKFNDPKFIELTINPGRCQYMEIFKHEKKLEEAENIDSLVLVVMTKTDIFWKDIFPRYNEKVPMERDNMTDRESMVSFQTIRTIEPEVVKRVMPMKSGVAVGSSQNLPNVDVPPTAPRPTVVETPKKAAEVKLPAILEDFEDEQSEIELPAPKYTQAVLDTKQAQKSEGPSPKKISPIKKVAPVKEAPAMKNLPAAKSVPPIRNMLKVGPLEPCKNTQTVYDNPPSMVKMPPAKTFLENSRLERLRNSQTQDIFNTETTVPDNSQDVDWNPKGGKRKPPKRRSTPAAKRKLEEKLQQFSTDEENVEISKPVKRNTRRPAAKPRAVNYSTECDSDQYGETKNAQPVQKKAQPEPKKVQPLQKKAQPESKKVQLEQKPPQLTKEQTITARRAAFAKIDSNIKRSAPQKKEPPAKKTRAVFDDLFNINSQPSVQKPPAKVARKLESKEEVVPQKRIRFEIYEDGESDAAAPEQEEGPQNQVKGILKGKNDKKTPPPSNIKQFFAPEKDSNQSKPGKQTPAKVEAPRKIIRSPSPVVDDYEDDIEVPETPQDVHSHDPYTQKPPPVTPVVHNYDVLANNRLLQKYVQDSTHRTIERNFDSPNDPSTLRPAQLSDEYESVTVTRKIRETSSTIVRTVQIQEVVRSPSHSQDENEDCGDSEIRENFELIIKRKLKPIKEKSKKIAEAFSIKRLGLKAKLRAKTKETKKVDSQYRSHIQEHIRLLKRLHQSKSKMMQLFEESHQTHTELDTILLEIQRELRNVQVKRKEAAKKINEEIVEAHTETKAEVWGKYIDGISSRLTSVLNKYKNI